MGFDTNSLVSMVADLESGSSSQMSKRMRDTLLFVRAHRSKLLQLAGLMLFVTIILTSKAAMQKADTVSSSLDAISDTIVLEEPTYQPLSYERSMLDLEELGDLPVKPYSIKSSAMNRKLQILDLAAAAADADKIMAELGVACLPARFMGIDYSILFVFEKPSMINIHLESVSYKSKHLVVESNYGVKETVKLPLDITVSFISGATLNPVYMQNLEDTEGFCVSYYLSEKNMV